MRSSSIALWIWYQGHNFDGFQTQVCGRTVQQTLKEILGAAGLSSRLAAAGRTDKGVHARMQVVRIRNSPDSIEGLRRRLEGLLPADLGVCAARIAPAHFHPQWRCTGKEYRYRVRLDGRAPAAWAAWSWSPMEDVRLQGRSPRIEELRSLISLCSGTRDFVAFHESSSPRRLRTLSSAELKELGAGLFEVKLRGDAFARYQARYLVGSAVAAAAGILSPDAFRAALEDGERIKGIKAPAAGLVLWEIFYEPSMDPFTAEDRIAPPGLPSCPPFALA